MSAEIMRLGTALRTARVVTVLVGADLSADEAVSPADSQEREWVDIEPSDIATPEEFRQAPERVWRWYMSRRASIARRSPFPALLALNDLLQRLPRTHLITGNVDGMLERGGTPVRPLELHGSVWRTRCMGCGRVRADTRSAHPELPPRCTHCGGILRPDVVWFGEALNTHVLDQAVRAACVAEVMLVVGGRVNHQPAASLVAHARENEALVVEIGLDARAGGLCQLALPGPPEDTLRALVRQGLTRPPDPAAPE
ncbi:MAG: NAD-dependent deacylase [Myxococcales bacterium]|nr:NAD-dependent deacylase [Myxococcales bacterium]